MKSRRLLVIFLLSVTLVGLELIWTRLFSAEFYYTFAFLVLSLAIMGLGLGALATRMFHLADREGNLGTFLSLTAVAALAGPPLVFTIGLDFGLLYANPAMVPRFVLAIAFLGLPFFFGGICLATLFRKSHSDMPRLYMADLTGAGVGVIAGILLMNVVGTPAATFVCSIPVLCSAFIASSGRRRAVPLVLALCVGILCFFSGSLLERDRPESGPVIYTHWDAMAKIKVYGYGKEYRGLNLDNVAKQAVLGFDGNWDRPGDGRFEFAIDVGDLIGRFDSCTFLSIGAGGGMDVMQALQEGATEIHAVEVNPHINRMMTEGDPSGYIVPNPEIEWLKARRMGGKRENQILQGQLLHEPDHDGIITMAEFSGRIYHDPRVVVATEDARAYVGRFENKFDVIYSLSPNTFIALASGSFALAENYLFTTEAFQDYWKALSEDGFLMMEHEYYMPRLVASMLDALEGLGVQDPGAHIAVYELPRMKRKMILMSRQPLTDEIRRNAFGAITEDNHDEIHLLYPVPAGQEDNLINRIVLDGWKSAADDAWVDISPTTDDRPFVGQMGLWRNLSRDGNQRLQWMEIHGFPLSKVLIVTILAVLIVLIVPLNLLPYVIRGEKLRAVPWLYFFVIGAAFMIVEVVLIQKYTFFVGPSAYSIATILLTLLIASGIGSRFSTRFGDVAPFVAIAVWVLVDVTIFRYLIHDLGSLSMGPRIMVTMLMVAPLGFFMGMPFPKGALRVGELVDWGFAVNGAASVLGATAILLVAFQLGLSVAMLIGAVLYLAALGLLSMRHAWNMSSS